MREERGGGGDDDEKADGKTIGNGRARIDRVTRVQSRRSRVWSPQRGHVCRRRRWVARAARARVRARATITQITDGAAGRIITIILRVDGIVRDFVSFSFFCRLRDRIRIERKEIRRHGPSSNAYVFSFAVIAGNITV